MHWETEITNTQNDYIFISSVICMFFLPLNLLNRIGGIMVSALALIAVDCGFGSNQRLSMIGIFCFSSKHATLSKKSKDLLSRNQNNVYEWSDMSTRGLLFQ